MSADSNQDNVVRLHPGAGRNKSRIHLRGRQVNLDTLAQLREWIGDQPIKRDMLIEYLHLIQDNYGHLSAAHLAALAHEMNIPMAEVYELSLIHI